MVSSIQHHTSNHAPHDPLWADQKVIISTKVLLNCRHLASKSPAWKLSFLLIYHQTIMVFPGDLSKFFRHRNGYTFKPTCKQKHAHTHQLMVCGLGDTRWVPNSVVVTGIPTFLVSQQQQLPNIDGQMSQGERLELNCFVN